MDEEINLGEISIDEDIIQIPSINIPLIKGEKGDTGAKGEDGQDYVITSADYQEIADIVSEDVVEDKNFIYVQNEASSTWEINHNLNKYPSVTVIDSSGAEVIGGVEYLDNNNLTIIFKGGFKGTAILN